MNASDLRAMRARLSLSQHELALLLCYPDKSVQRLESPRGTSPAPTLGGLTTHVLEALSARSESTDAFAFGRELVRVLRLKGPLGALALLLVETTAAPDRSNRSPPLRKATR